VDSPKNYYSILGLTAEASQTDIKKAYRRLAFRYHPDHNRSGIHGEVRFRVIKEAYDTLTDPAIKRQYDATLQTRLKHVYAPSYSFGKFTSPTPPPRPPVPDMEEEIEIESKPWWQVWLKPFLLIIVSLILMWLILMWAGQ
jgi:curved DNA-binding protein CbpA